MIEVQMIVALKNMGPCMVISYMSFSNLSLINQEHPNLACRLAVEPHINFKNLRHKLGLI